MEEVAEDGWVFLRQACGGFLLRHCGTGDQILLEGSWSAAIENGNVKVQQQGHESVWACEFFPTALVQGPRLNYAEPQLCIVNVESETRVWRDDFLDVACKAHVIVFADLDPHWQCEVFISRVPKARCCIRFSLVRTVTFLMGSDFDGHWITKHV